MLYVYLTHSINNILKESTVLLLLIFFVNIYLFLHSIHRCSLCGNRNILDLTNREEYSEHRLGSGLFTGRMTKWSESTVHYVPSFTTGTWESAQHLSYTQCNHHSLYTSALTVTVCVLARLCVCYGELSVLGKKAPPLQFHYISLSSPGQGDTDSIAMYLLTDKSPSSGRNPYVNLVRLHGSPSPLNK